MRREARDALRDSERAISDANRKLARTMADGQRLRVQAAHIAEQRRALERLAAERQSGVERMLAARHAAGAPDPLRVALSGDDPGSLGRTLQYVGYVSQAAALNRQAISNYITRGPYCLEVIHPGTFPEDVDYTVRVSHP